VVELASKEVINSTGGCLVQLNFCGEGAFFDDLHSVTAD